MDEVLTGAGYLEDPSVSFTSISSAGASAAANAAEYYIAIAKTGVVTAVLVVWPESEGSQVDLKLTLEDEWRGTSCN
jgi:hypothetical protein